MYAIRSYYALAAIDPDLHEGQPVDRFIAHRAWHQARAPVRASVIDHHPLVLEIEVDDIALEGAGRQDILCAGDIEVHIEGSRNIRLHDIADDQTVQLDNWESYNFV